jgi:hypothetical protein
VMSLNAGSAVPAPSSPQPAPSPPPAANTKIAYRQNPRTGRRLP